MDPRAYEIAKGAAAILNTLTYTSDKDDDKSDRPTTGSRTNFTAPRPNMAMIGRFSWSGAENHTLTVAETHRWMAEAAVANAANATM